MKYELTEEQRLYVERENKKAWEKLRRDFAQQQRNKALIEMVLNAIFGFVLFSFIAASIVGVIKSAL